MLFLLYDILPKFIFQKSKYLGGDMEHTHLVKGLDYSLLNKVRTEIHEQQVSAKEKVSFLFDFLRITFLGIK